jgi:dTDP-4-amino-4,6-dideoxygalactose transaminase
MELMREPLLTGNVTNGGPLVQRAERMVADFVGVDAALFCNGHTALIAMLRAFDVAGGEVICPSFTFVSTPAAIVAAGATPVFADIDRRLTLDPGEVFKKITDRTKAILTVDAYGIPSDYTGLKLASYGKIPVLADSAAAFGSVVKSPDGLKGPITQPDAQIFSFHATKQVTAIEGGAVVSNRPEIIAACRRIRNFGQGGDAIREIGLNGKMSELHAAVLIENMKIGPRQIERQHAMLFYNAGLPEVVRFGCVDQIGVNWLYYPMVCDPSRVGMKANVMMARLAERGIGARRYYHPACHNMSAFRKAPTEELFWAQHTSKIVLCLPCYPELAGNDQAAVIEAVNEIVRLA